MGTVLCLLVIVLVAGCGGEEKRTSDEVAEGKKLFIRNGCAVCHGPLGRGDGPVAASLKPPPRDFSDNKAYKKGATVEAIGETIRRGVPQSAMPAYPHLDTEDLRLIAVYIQSLQGKATTEEAKE